MLKREISRWDLVLLLINSTIGAGIFGLPSQIYKLSGFYSLPALFLCALIVLVLVLVFAEVASRFKKTGGPYLYILSAFGKFPAFIIGWLILITRVSTYAALINLLVTYLGFFNEQLVSTPYNYLIIIAITFLFTWVNYLGVRNSTVLSNTLAIAKILPLLVFVVVG
ncbi:MAG TPA: amino acid permease, partial [Gillisia sp.]|nr:amino acid permease [Gillisia sp.]